MWRAWVAGVLACAAAGCLEYDIGCPPGRVNDGSSCRVVDACERDELPLLDGGCERIGVQDCGAIGELEDGGCSVKVPLACGRGELHKGMHPECLPVDYCPTVADQWASPAQFPLRLYVAPEYRGPSAPDARALPYPSIEAALEAANGLPATLFLEEGVHRGSVEVRSPVQIVGRCAAQTLLEPDGSGTPALTFSRGSEGSTVEHVGLTGGAHATAAGLLVEGHEGSAGVEIAYAHFFDISGSAVACDDAQATVHIHDTLIESVGVGVEARGSQVRIENVELKHLASTGIRVHPSRRAGASEASSWDPSGSLRSYLQVYRVIVDGAADTGILVEGSDAVVEESLIRNLSPGATGVAVRWRPTGANRGFLRLERSVVRGPFDVGVDVWSSELVLEDVDVDAGADEGCPRHGVGVLIRNDEIGAHASSTLKRAIVRGTSQAGIRVENTAAQVEDVIVRDIGATCATEQGNGIAVVSYQPACEACAAFPLADLEVKRSRIEHTAGAGVVAFPSAQARVTRAHLECTGHGVSGSSHANDAVCRCHDVAVLCPEEGSAPPSPLAGSSPCDAQDGAVCAGWRVGALIGPSQNDAPIADATLRVLDPLGAVPMLSDGQGAVERDGTFEVGQPVLQLVTKPGFMARSHAFTTGSKDLKLAWTVNVPSFDVWGFAIPQFEIDPIALDLSLGTMQIEVCRRQRPPANPAEVLPDEYCGRDDPSRAIPGTRVRLVPLSDGPVERASVVYQNTTGWPDPTLTAMDEAFSYVWVFGVRPGFRTLEVTLPPGPRLSCSLELADGWQGGWELVQDPVDWQTVFVRLPVAEAQYNAGTYVMCSEASS
jgi:hypothetical protein